LAGLVGLSPGYGAFLIGLIIGNSTHGHDITRHAHSIQAVLLMVFFLSVGLLLDLGFLWNNIGSVLLLLLVVTVFKTALNIGALRLQRVPWGHAFLAGVALAQIGEFSFLLSGAGVAKGLLGQDDAQLVVAVSVLSLTISPLWLLTMRRLAAARGGFSSLPELLGGIYGGEARAAQQGYSFLRRGLGRVPLPSVPLPKLPKVAMPWPRRKDEEDTQAPEDIPTLSQDETAPPAPEPPEAETPAPESTAPDIAAAPTTVPKADMTETTEPETTTPEPTPPAKQEQPPHA
jgi:CPA2 family monovalent cation:H+ antiporter-2